jgi:hypothetical protein
LFAKSIAMHIAIVGALSLGAAAAPAIADPFFFGTGGPDGKIAAGSRSGPGFEIETADDFIVTQVATLNSATFTGLIPAGSSVLNVVVEIYRVFPSDSDVTRTSGSPLFSTSLGSGLTT